MKTKRTEEFKLRVENKFHVYNSLFLNLPYSNIKNTGILIPILSQNCEQGLREGLNPSVILEKFFENHTDFQSEEERMEFMFKVIQYVERQVVLFDSVEDAAFTQLKEMGDYLSIHDFFQLSESKKNWDNIGSQLKEFSTRLVFTAHPTQFYPPNVLHIIKSLRDCVQNDQIENIYTLLQQLGLTSLINPDKPTPLEEAKNIIHYLRNVYYQAIGDWFSHLKSLLKSESFNNYDLIRLGFWPGGDRDGNPFVTSKTTWQVANELRMTLMKCYYNDLKILQKKLTFKGVDKPLNQLVSTIYDTMFDSEKLLNVDEAIHTLKEIKKEIDLHYNGLYIDDVKAMIDKMNIFKSHFASLDIRQNHAVHKNAVNEILIHNGIIKENLEELSTDQLVDFLTNSQISLDNFDSKDDLINDTIDNIRQLPIIQKRNGIEGCHRYIISNSEDAFAVLHVLALMRWILKTEEINFDIVPLFETMEGMKNAPEIMRFLYKNEAYKAHLNRRNKVQTMMLGFSDGTKDGGYLKANWSIFKTKEELTRVSEEFEMKALFFDGRGGPPARGGGKTHRFYAAQGNTIANHGIQLTIQGQTITSTFGNRDQFIHNCEQLITAGLANKYGLNKNEINEKERSLIEELAEISHGKYVDLKNHPKFISYLENRSTLKYYGKANIGSRPGKRGNKKQLTLEDLRAISFVGSWSQLKQNVPGYFGIGTALKKLEIQDRLAELKDLFSNVPFFKALMLNSMMSLSKCYFELTAYMGEDPDYSEFWKILHEEYLLSMEMTLKIANYHVLMEEEPIAKQSVKMREDIVLPLLVIQQHALQQIHAGHPQKEVFEKLVTRSLYGNINASRNSA